MNLSIIGNPMEETIGRQSREERKKAREERKKSGKPSKFKKIALAVPRGAFLGLVLLNVRGMASRLSELNKKNPAKVRAMWLRLGGDPDKLIKNLDRGAKKKRLLGAEIYQDQGVGFAIPAALASAAPIIAVVSKFLKDNGIAPGEGESLDDIKPAPGEEINTDSAAADPETPEAAKAQPTGESKKDTTTGGMSISPTTGLLIGGGLLAAFLLFKKK